jgi:hypothetical protein
MRVATERRSQFRFEVHLPMQYHVTSRSSGVPSGTATTVEMSRTGLSFRTRKPIPVGTHLKMTMDWPARSSEGLAMVIQATGYVIRSHGGTTAVCFTSRRLRTVAETHTPLRVSA